MRPTSPIARKASTRCGARQPHIGRSVSRRLRGFRRRSSSRLRACSAARVPAMVLTARGAEQQSHGVDNVLAFINIALALGKVGQPVQRIRHADRPGEWAGRARARAEGRSAAGIPPHRRSAARRAHRRGLGNPRSGSAGSRQVRLRADSICRRTGRLRALLVIGSNPARVGAERDARRGAARAARFSRRRRFLLVRDRELRRRRAALGAVGGGRRHHHESRRAGHPPPPRARTRRQVSTDIDFLCHLARALGKSRVRSHSRVLRRCSMSCAPQRAAAPPTTRESHTSGSIAKTACSGPARRIDHPGTPRLFDDRFPTPSGRARFHAVEHDGPAEVPDERISAPPDDRPRARALPVGNADAAGRAARRGRAGTVRRNSSAGCPAPRAGRGCACDSSDAPRIGDVRQPDHA